MSKKVFYIVVCFVLAFMEVKALDYVRTDDGKVTCSWNAKDAVGLYTESATYLKYFTHEVSEADPHNAVATGIMALEPNRVFYSVQPYNNDYRYISGYGTLPVTYSSQRQNGNDDLHHIAAFDYMTSQTRSTSSSAEFVYGHVGSVIRFAVHVPQDMTFTSLAMKSLDGKPWFVSKATMNAATSVVTPVETVAEAILKLDNVSVPADGNLVAYMMVSPMELKGRTFSVTLVGADGMALTANVTGCNIKSGKVYPLEIGEDDITIEDGQEKDETPSDILSLRDMAEGLDEPQTSAVGQIVSLQCVSRDFEVERENTLKPFLLGDVNHDGVVDTVDAIMLNGYYLNNATSQLDSRVCDLNRDGRIDVADVVAIIGKYLNGK